MALYQSKPQVVDAEQWTGALVDVQRLMKWAEGKVRLNAGVLELLAGKDGAQGWVPVPVGHWLVHPPDDLSDIWPVEVDYFAGKYELAS
jgi:hypothetical protein